MSPLPNSLKVEFVAQQRHSILKESAALTVAQDVIGIEQEHARVLVPQLPDCRDELRLAQRRSRSWSRRMTALPP
jgi:hypothetical protein